MFNGVRNVNSLWFQCLEIQKQKKKKSLVTSLRERDFHCLISSGLKI